MNLRISIFLLAIAGCFMVEAPAQSASMIRFDRSQRDVFEDQSRIIGVNFHRQKGKDFVASAKAVNEAIDRNQNWFIVAMTQAQADETFLKAKKCVDATKRLLKAKFKTDQVAEEHESFKDYDRQIDQAFEARAHTLVMPNGARVVSLPGRNPDSLAGRTGNQIWTEFGLWANGGYEHWSTLFPIITRGAFKLMLISTPRGKNTKFYEVMGNEDGLYSTHTCDIYKSVFEEGYQLYDAKGSPFPQHNRIEQELAIATFRKMYKDEAKWPREYECKFTGDMSALIPWAELERASCLDNPDGFTFRMFRDQQTAQPIPAELVGSLRGTTLEIGWDVARRGHLSVIAVNKRTSPSTPRRLIGVIAMHNCSFEFMRAAVVAIMDTSRSNVGFGDATGLGMESNEVLEKKYGGPGGRWTPFTFTATGKREVASALRTGFSDGMQTLPPMDGPHKMIATDLYAIQKDDTGAALQLEETPNALLNESHCDIGYAIGMARLAGAKNSRVPMISMAEKPFGF